MGKSAFSLCVLWNRKSQKSLTPRNHLALKIPAAHQQGLLRRSFLRSSALNTRQDTAYKGEVREGSLTSHTGERLQVPVCF